MSTLRGECMSTPRGGYSSQHLDKTPLQTVASLSLQQVLLKYEFIIVNVEKYSTISRLQRCRGNNSYWWTSFLLLKLKHYTAETFWQSIKTSTFVDRFHPWLDGLEPAPPFLFLIIRNWNSFSLKKKPPTYTLSLQIQNNFPYLHLGRIKSTELVGIIHCSLEHNTPSVTLLGSLSSV